MNLMEQAVVYLETYIEYGQDEFLKTLSKSDITSVTRTNSGAVCIWFGGNYHTDYKHEFFLSREELIKELV